jgi:hypothetical protein
MDAAARLRLRWAPIHIDFSPVWQREADLLGSA